MEKHTKNACFGAFEQQKNTLDPHALSIQDLSLLGLEDKHPYLTVEDFYTDYIETRLHEFQQKRVLVMSEEYYALSWLMKLWLLFGPLLEFFESFGDVWLHYFLTQDRLRKQLESLFSHDLDEFILISRYVELCQEFKLIASQRDSDELADELHQALYRAFKHWTPTSPQPKDVFKVDFMNILDIKNLD
jgi:hypothetical protein